VSGVTAQNILATLAKAGPAPAECILDKKLLAFDPEAGKDLDILLAIGFLEQDDEQKLGISEEGRQFIASLIIYR